MVYLNSARPAQLLALASWLLRLSPDRRPSVLLEFGTEPGVEIRIDDDGPMIGLPDLRDDPRAVLYRFAARSLRAGELSRFRLATFEPDSSAAYAALLDVDVAVLPFPHHAVGKSESRIGRRPVTVAILGHQRPDKGYHLVPEIVRRLLLRRADARLLVHNGAPEGMRDTQDALRDIARNDTRLRLDERTADDVLWRQLLSQADLIVCPYDPVRFATSYSAVAVEAIAYGIPLVVPAKTALSRLLTEFGEPGTTFASPDPESIGRAIEQALERYDDIASRALKAAGEWERQNGPRPLVDAMLALLAAP
jgi:glycosyltransferase involved in cell wall biosynthesis